MNRPHFTTNTCLVICAGILFLPRTQAADDSTASLPENDPWYYSQGWPGSRSVNPDNDRAWWDTEVSEWPQWERGVLRAGGMVADFDTSLQFSLQGAVGISIDAEKLLGLESRLRVFRFDGLWRFGERKRNTLDFTVSSYKRSSTATAQADIDFGNGTVIPVGATMDSVFDFDIYRLSYTYSFFQDERMNIGAGLGLYIAPIKYGLTFTPVNGSTVGFDTQDVTLPLPAIALRGQYRITPRLYLITDLDFMYLEINDFQGSLVDLRLSMEYQLWRYFGVGLGYNVFKIDVSASDSGDYISNYVGNVELGYGGLMLYGKLSF